MKLIITLLFSSVAIGSPMEDIKNEILRVEQENGLPEGLLLSLVKVESSLDPLASNLVAEEYSYGLGQLTERSAKYHCGLNLKNIFDVSKNLECSAKILKHKIKKYRFNIKYATAAYNAGTACVCKHGSYVTPFLKLECPIGPKTCSEENKILNEEYVNKIFDNWDSLTWSKPLNFGPQ